MGMAVMAPVFAVTDGLVVQQLLALLSSVTLVVVAATSRATDIKQAVETTRWLWFTALLPAIWLAFQILPLPASIAHSIWATASEALQEKLYGHISIDPGRTLNSFVQYLASAAIVLVGILVLRDRRRAELMLFTLCGISTCMVFGLTLTRSGYLGSVDGSSFADITETLVAVSMIGLLVNLAAAARVVEHYEVKNRSTDESYRSAAIKFSVCAAAAVSCLSALITVATLNVGIVLAFGVTIFLSNQLFRRLVLSRWLTGAFCATIIVAGAMIVAWRYDGSRPVSGLLQFATTISSDALDPIRRMISDANWTGTGGGTFAVLPPIYGDPGLLLTRPPTTASSIAIEWGRPALFIVIAMAIQLIIVLFLGALARGRDSFYSAAAASCVVILLGEAFCDASLLRSSVALIGEIVVGLGLAQSVSRAATG